MKTKHTPGPWRVGSLRENNGIVIEYDGPDHRWHVADVFGQIDTNAPRITRQGFADANAQLIAAAPDLLEVCDDARNGLLEWMSNHNDDVDETDDSLLAKIDATIAKATRTN